MIPTDNTQTEKQHELQESTEDSEQGQNQTIIQIESNEEFSNICKLLIDYDTTREDTQHSDNLFENPSEVFQQLDESRVPNYVPDFETEVDNDALNVAIISIDQIQAEEKHLCEEKIKYDSQEVEKALRIKETQLVDENEAKLRIALFTKEKREQLQRREDLLTQMKRQANEEIRAAYHQAENQLIDALNLRKAEVTTYNGDLQLVSGMFNGVEGRRYRIDWTSAPQPIEVKVVTMRGVRDKLPVGRYVVHASVMNRLSGEVLRWSKLSGQNWGSTTKPVKHDGHFVSTEIQFNQSLFTTLPASGGLTPLMVLCFEVFLLRGSVVPVDTVVGWGVLPVCDGQFEAVEGKYKIPLLRGHMDPIIDKHYKMEELFAHDLDNWLSNLYVHIVRLPRYIAGQTEFAVELQFSSNLLNFPERLDTAGEGCVDSEEPLWDVERRASAQAVIQGDTTSDAQDSQYLSGPGSTEDNESETNTIPNLPGSSNKKGEPQQHLFGKPTKTSFLTAASCSRQQQPQQAPPPYTVVDLSPAVLSLGGPQVTGFRTVDGQPGLFYKTYTRTAKEDYIEKVNTLLPQTPLIRPVEQVTAKGRLQELEQHGFAIKHRLDCQFRPLSEGSRRMRFFTRMFAHEVGQTRWRSAEFWVLLLFVLFNFFFRLYLHYCGQWIFLALAGIPINAFNFFPHTVQLNYQWTLLTTGQEAAVVVLGPLTPIIILGLLMSISTLAQYTIRFFPRMASQFILAFAIMTLLNPLLVLIVDLILRRDQNLGGSQPIADAAKLYYHFLLVDGSGIPGIVVTLVLYTVLFSLTMGLFYLYFLRLHNEGALLDIYWRIHGPEHRFFVPQDMEVSPPELAYIVTKAERWRGGEGERRRILVKDYEWRSQLSTEDPTEEEVLEVTSHVAITTVHLDGLVEPYREFLRHPDGSIIEIIANVNKDDPYNPTRGFDQEEKNLKINPLNSLNLTSEEPVTPKQDILPEVETVSIVKQPANSKKSRREPTSTPVAAIGEGSTSRRRSRNRKKDE